MKFGQSIEHNIRDMFFEKLYKKCGGDTLPRPFSKKTQLSISLDQKSKVLYSLSFTACQVEDSQNRK